jgi:hypothetical protein
LVVSHAGRVVRTERPFNLLSEYEGGGAFRAQNTHFHICGKLGIERGRAGYITSLAQVDCALEAA